MAIKQREPKTLKPDWSDEAFVIRPMPARKSFGIDRRFSTDPDTGLREDYVGYCAAMMAASLYTEAGTPAFTEDQFADLDLKYFWDLWQEAATYLGLRADVEGDDAKN